GSAVHDAEAKLIVDMLAGQCDRRVQRAVVNGVGNHVSEDLKHTRAIDVCGRQIRPSFDDQTLAALRRQELVRARGLFKQVARGGVVPPELDARLAQLRQIDQLLDAVAQSLQI